MGASAIRRTFVVVAALVAMGFVPAAAASPSPATSGPLSGTYVALGDSYTSGPLIPGYEAPYGCLKSTDDYPHLVARRLGLTLRDASCAGAEIGDMYSAQGVTPGPNPPQLDSLDATTTLVTLQVGGNDIGFSSIATDCVALNPFAHPCQDKYVVGGDDMLHDRIEAIEPRLETLIHDIHDRAPNAAVAVIPYLAILPETNVITCWPSVPIAYADIPYLRGTEDALNGVLATAAAHAGATYIDVHAASIGHDACKAPVVRWVEPVVPVGPAAPLHPNLGGMLGEARVIEAALTG